MEGFFEGVDIIAEAMAFVSAEVLVPPSRLIPTKKGSPVKGDIIRESAPFSTGLVTSQKGATSLVMT